ncbi:PiggyBac transposable element-derived protein 3 [Elysia marginata]|uniref:PiggyBac transposable element-derived protein 3 n=1 Tax=Elysia marginata TaxID=1093978 RepID=A0AAV4I1N2_9GAST|nr:PiggyBac transposable element-derived protein 3 [Elysia marginata]
MGALQKEEDDVNEGIQESLSASDLSGRQLRSRAHCRVKYTDGSKETRGDEPDDDQDSECSSDDRGNEVPSTTASTNVRKQTITAHARQWRKEDLPATLIDWDTAPPLFLQKHVTPTKCFERFFGDTVVEHIIRETIKIYANGKGGHSFKTDFVEVRAFFSIVLVCGYNSLPRRRMYWEQQDDCHNSAISKTMSRNRFELLMRYIHVADNNKLIAGDKFAKIKPLYNLLNERFVRFFPVQQHPSIDESRIPYYDKHSLKQCIRGKVIRIGCKQWVIATPLGHAPYLDLYQRASAAYDRKFGLGHSVAMGLVNQLPNGPHYHLYFDNFFTGLRLLKGLSDTGSAATGTVGSNRTEKCPTDLIGLKNAKRGSIHYRHDRHHGIVVCAWNDNSIVTLASNQDGVFPMAKESR